MKPVKKAVALQYPPEADAPFIAFSAKGLLAEELVKTAESCRIPIYQDDNLVNILSVCEIGIYIPAETYEALAIIFACILKNEQRNRKNGI